MRYYVYALIDPTRDNKPFYIGKGTDNRLKSHFTEALSSGKGCAEGGNTEIDIGIIAENEMEEYNNQQIESPKIKKLRELFNLGYGYENIARILAKDLDEPIALGLESFLIKTIYGLGDLTNKVEGERSGRFRPYNNWECIDGFDLSSTSNRGVGKNRMEKLKYMLAEKLDEPLLRMSDAFPNLKFTEPKVVDSGELGIEADVRGTRIKFFIRKMNIQIELRGRKKEQHEWIKKHFEKIEGKHLLRKDNIFIPNRWKGSKNMISDVQMAIERANLLLEIVNAENKGQLSTEALQLLDF